MELELIEDLALELFELGFSVAIKLDPLTLIVRGPIRKTGLNVGSLNRKGGLRFESY